MVLALLVTTQVYLSTPEKALDQAKLCLSAFGYGVPEVKPKQLQHTSPGFKNPCWIVTLGAFDIRLADDGALEHFERQSGSYALSPTVKAPKTAEQALAELVRLCREAGVAKEAWAEFISWKPKGSFDPKTATELSTTLFLTVNGRKLVAAWIWLDPRDGSVLRFFPGHSEGLPRLQKIAATKGSG